MQSTKLKTSQKKMVLLWSESAQTQSAFCRHHQIPLSSFSTWVRKARELSLIQHSSSSNRRRRPKAPSVPEGFVQAKIRDDVKGPKIARSLVIRTSYGLTLEVPL